MSIQASASSRIRPTSFIARSGAALLAVAMLTMTAAVPAQGEQNAQYVTRDQIRSQGGLKLKIGERQIRITEIRSLESPAENCKLDVPAFRARLQRQPKQLEVECKGEICTVHTGKKGEACAGEGRRCMIIFENLTAPAMSLPARP